MGGTGRARELAVMCEMEAGAPAVATAVTAAAAIGRPDACRPAALLLLLRA